MTVARVAITGFMHEANVFAPPITLADARRLDPVPDDRASAWEAGHAVRRLRELRDVEIVPLPAWELGACGPLLDDEFSTLLDEVTSRARAAGPIDGLLVMGHGAGRAVTDLDTDATFLRALRDVIGPDVPLVMVLDFHANVSVQMCELADVLVGYRTNPHVDIAERSVEAAEQLHRLLDGGRTVVARCRPPLILPQLAQNTTPGEPLAEVRDAGGSFRVMNAPFRMSGGPTKVRDFAAALGEHTREILAETGYSQAEIAALAATGAINR